jgi:hypothetical protein
MQPFKSGRLFSIWDGGEYRSLGCLPTEPQLLGAASRFGDSFPTLEADDLKECDFAFHGSPVRNQKQFGSCGGQAGVTSLDICLRMIGEKPPYLSATFPYALANGGRDQGSSLGNILKILKTYGTCTEELMPTEKIYKQQIPQEAWEIAKKFMVLDNLLCRTYKEMISAIGLGFPVELGIMVGKNFGELDSEGVCPLPDQILGGHALCGMGIKKSQRTGEWLIKVQNSWAIQWGIKGYAFIRAAHFGQIGDAWAMVYPKELRDSSDAPPVPNYQAA